MLLSFRIVISMLPYSSCLRIPHSLLHDGGNGSHQQFDLISIETNFPANSTRFIHYHGSPGDVVHVYFRGPLALGVHTSKDASVPIPYNLLLGGTYAVTAVKEYESVGSSKCKPLEYRACFSGCNPSPPNIFGEGKTCEQSIEWCTAKTTEYRECINACNNKCGAPSLVQSIIFQQEIHVAGSTSFHFPSEDCRGTEALGEGIWLKSELAGTRARHDFSYTWFPVHCQLVDRTPAWRNFNGVSNTDEIINRLGVASPLDDAAVEGKSGMKLITHCPGAILCDDPSLSFGPAVCLTMRPDPPMKATCDIAQDQYNKQRYVFQRIPAGTATKEVWDPTDMKYHGVRGWNGIRYLVKDYNDMIEASLPDHVSIFKQDVMASPWNASDIKGDGLHFWSEEAPWFIENVLDVLKSVEYQA